MELFQNFRKERDRRNIDIIKHFTVVSSALLAVMISKPTWYSHSKSCLYEPSIHLSMISVFAGCLFFLILLLQYDRMDKDFRADGKDLIGGRKSLSEIYISTKYNLALKICKYVCVLSFLIALVLFLLPLIGFSFLVV